VDDLPGEDGDLLVVGEYHLSEDECHGEPCLQKRARPP
jgi:hypothetical protein